MKRLAFYLALVLPACLAACAREGAAPTAAGLAAATVFERANDPVRLTPGAAAGTARFDEAARFLAGRGLPAASPLAAFTNNEVYRRYHAAINQEWAAFQAGNLERMRAWRRTALPPQRQRTVFYPFSGPDILPLLALYPQANDILLFGLEAIGDLPDPLALPRERIVADLAGLNEALEFIFRHSFFVTKDMETQVAAASPYTGVAGVLFFLLAREGCVVIDAKHLALDRSGALSERRVTVADLEKPAEAVPVLEILFRIGDEPGLRRLRYVNANIGDWSGTRDHLLAYLDGWGPASTMLKSASYLLHNESHFSGIRRAILAVSSEILQDDSGIPFRVFNSREWALSFHGKYHRPLSFFMKYLQPDLERAVAAGSSGPLPFAYGYGYAYRTITYHLQHAVKRMQ